MALGRLKLLLTDGSTLADNYQEEQIKDDYVKMIVNSLGQTPYNYSIDLFSTDMDLTNYDSDVVGNVFKEFYDGKNIHQVINNNYGFNILVEYIEDVDMQTIEDEYPFSDFSIDEFIVVKYKSKQSYNSSRSHKIDEMKIGLKGFDEEIINRFKEKYTINSNAIIDEYLFYDGSNHEIIQGKL